MEADREEKFERQETPMKSRWIIHNDKRIFIADYSEHDNNLNALRVEVAAVIETLSQEPFDSVLALTDVHYTFATDVRSLTALLEDSFPKANPYIKKRAMIGLPECRRYLVPLFEPLTGSKQYRMFNRMRDALDWLASE